MEQMDNRMLSEMRSYVEPILPIMTSHERSQFGSWINRHRSVQDKSLTQFLESRNQVYPIIMGTKDRQVTVEWLAEKKLTMEESFYDFKQESWKINQTIICLNHARTGNSNNNVKLYNKKYLFSFTSHRFITTSQVVSNQLG